MGQIRCARQDFSRQKTWYIFDSKPDTIQKRRLFFLRTIFLPKDLVYLLIEIFENGTSQVIKGNEYEHSASKCTVTS